MSTLADLEPEIFEELRFPDLTATRSSRGSVRFPIKQPQKAAEGGRAYVHGDPLNMIDWRAYARTDQLIIREQQKEAAAKVRIYLDLRASMDWPDASLSGVLQRQDLPMKKQIIAYKVALNLAFRHLREQDLVELVIIHEDDGEFLYYRVKPRSKNDIHHLYEEIFPQATFTGLESMAGSDLEQGSFDLGYCISDMLVEPEQNLVLLQNCRLKLLLQVLSSLELDSAWMQADKIYFELADTQEYQGNTLLLADAYKTKLAKWLEDIERLCQRSDINRVLLADSMDLGLYFKMMREFLDPRMRL